LVLDRDNSGTIEPEEIIDYLISENRNRDAANQIDDDMAAQLADEIMHNLDSNNDGKISLDEFAD
jgi:Ca2+-binding EF-hand superfamily protein